MTTKIKHWLLPLLVILLAGWATAHFTRTVIAEYRQPYGHDLFLFAQAGQRFWQTGELYERSADPAHTYRPGAPVFKFPPPYQLAIAPWMTRGMPDAFFWHAQNLMLLLYAGTLLLLFHLARTLSAEPTGTTSAGDRHTALLAGLVLTLGLTAPGVFGAFALLTAEMPLLLALMVALGISKRQPWLAGLLLAYAASCKLYPAFMLLYFLLLREGRAFIGFTIGLALIWGSSIALFGWPEHLFYLAQILPALLQEGVSDYHANLGLASLPLKWAIEDPSPGTLLFACRLVCLLGTGFGFWHYRSTWLAHRPLLFAWLLLAMLLCLANYWPQYLLYLLPAQVFLGARLLAQGRWLALLALLLLSVWLLVRPEWALHSLLMLAPEAQTSLNVHAQSVGLLPALWQHNPATVLLLLLERSKALVLPLLWLGCLAWIRGTHRGNTKPSCSGHAALPD